MSVRNPRTERCGNCKPWAINISPEQRPSRSAAICRMYCSRMLCGNFWLLSPLFTGASRLRSPMTPSARRFVNWMLPWSVAWYSPVRRSMTGWFTAKAAMYICMTAILSPSIFPILTGNTLRIISGRLRMNFPWSVPMVSMPGLTLFCWSTAFRWLWSNARSPAWMWKRVWSRMSATGSLTTSPSCLSLRSW